MSHMVSYRGQDGKQSYHQTDDLSDAIAFVEHLRNDEALDHARIFRMEELTFEYRPYYRVELATATATAPPAPDAGASLAVLPPPLPVDAAAEWPGATAEHDDSMTRMDEMDETTDDVDPLAAVWSSTERADRNDASSVGAGMGRRGLFGR